MMKSLFSRLVFSVGSFFFYSIPSLRRSGNPDVESTEISTDVIGYQVDYGTVHRLRSETTWESDHQDEA